MIAKAYSSFFEELQSNNTTEWFRANKGQYKVAVKKPFLSLPNGLIRSLQKWDYHVFPEAKKPPISHPILKP